MKSDSVRIGRRADADVLAGVGAGLSDTPGARHRDIERRRYQRHLHAHARRGAEQALGPADRGREPAGGQFNIGARACADAAPDGYTICIMPTDVLQYNRHVFKTLNYDLFKDLEPVTLLFFLTQALVASTSLNVTTLDQLAAASKANPGKLSYTAAAIPHQLFMEKLQQAAAARHRARAVQGRRRRGQRHADRHHADHLLRHRQFHLAPARRHDEGHRGRRRQALAAVSRYPDHTEIRPRHRADTLVLSALCVPRVRRRRSSRRSPTTWRGLPR